MAEPLSREPLARAPVLDAQRPGHGPHPAAVARLLPPCARFVFRGAPEAAARAGTAFGPGLPTTACRAAASGARAALWLGPDEWHLLAPEPDADAIPASIAAALGTLPYALVAIGHRNAALEISGPRAADVLSAGCPLDLHPAAFPVGMCTRTVLGKAEIILWRTGEATFHVGVWRSFAPYAWDFLIEARARL
jgi:sarcosine oxidase subunit gamma